ncbi:unnamed protein product [Bursaphelenchus okinawaensis]|uniref:HAT C-terminal dimerisation domain-containing protein n=1 Tax=Bursaphelenchus okinawaensis TaxID=465554 RepID=A0A811KCV4_9BILA|nr:unnamed protein product [Bursaphelenchus okinawaensis]CAG9101157.1 unnamed protein product [Bursaphelenchus okinawaensis]
MNYFRQSVTISNNRTTAKAQDLCQYNFSSDYCSPQLSQIGVNITEAKKCTDYYSPEFGATVKYIKEEFANSCAKSSSEAKHDIQKRDPNTLKLVVLSDLNNPSKSSSAPRSVLTSEPVMSSDASTTKRLFSPSSGRTDILGSFVTTEEVTLNTSIDDWPTFSRRRGERTTVEKLGKSYFEVNVHKNSYMTFSPQDYGIYCRACVLFCPFGVGASGGGKAGEFVSRPFTDWGSYNKGQSRGKTHHINTEYHKECCRKTETFILSMLNPEKDIRTKAANTETDRLNFGRKTAFDNIVFCARNGLDLRGTNSNIVTVPQNASDFDPSDGNYTNLLKARLRWNDPLAHDVMNGSKSFHYNSGQVQNEILAACGKVTRESIKSELTFSRYISIGIDETTDESNQSQMTVILRYLKDFTIVERFWSFVRLEKADSEYLTEVIVKAANMKGCHNGVQKRLLDRFPLATFYYCSIHALNLSLTKGTNCDLLIKGMKIINDLSTYINNSPKRAELLSKAIEGIKGPQERRRKLLKLFATRWCERSDSVIVFFDCINPIVAMLIQLDQTSALDIFTAQATVQQIIDVIKGWNLKKGAGSFNNVMTLVQNLKQEINLYDAVDVYDDHGMAKIEEKHTEMVKKLGEQILKTFDKTFSLTRSLGLFLPANVTNFDDVKEICDFCMENGALTCSTVEMQTEFERCVQTVTQNKSKLETADYKMLLKYTMDLYPNVHVLLKIFFTISPSNATAERTFSSMKFLKSSLRNRMKQDRLNDCSTIYINKDIEIDEKKVLVEFMKDNRRFDFGKVTVQEEEKESD